MDEFERVNMSSNLGGREREKERKKKGKSREKGYLDLDRVD